MNFCFFVVTWHLTGRELLFLSIFNPRVGSTVTRCHCQSGIRLECLAERGPYSPSETVRSIRSSKIFDINIVRLRLKKFFCGSTKLEEGTPKVIARALLKWDCRRKALLDFAATLPKPFVSLGCKRHVGGGRAWSKAFEIYSVDER